MSITKPTHISKHLEDLIEAANNNIITVKEQIMEIYHTALKEGFPPLEARVLIEERVIKVSKRYIRLVLPEEAKDIKKITHKSAFKGDAEVVPHIPTAYDIKEAETTTEKVKEWDLPEPTQSEKDDGFDESQNVIYDKDLVDRYVKEINRLEKENAQLRIAKVPTFGNKFDFDYDYEMPSGDIVPFIVTVFPDKKTGYIRLNKEKIKEAERKRGKK